MIIVIISSALFLSNRTFPGGTSKPVGMFPGEGDVTKSGAADNGRVPYYADLVIEGINLDNDDSSYSVRQGEFFQNGIGLDPDENKEKTDRILRLALFYQWAKEDPLMASSTLDAEKIGLSVNSLKAHQDEFIKTFGYDADIFAVGFFGKYIDSSIAYRDLSKNISEKNARILLGKMEDADNAYNKDEENLSGAVEDLKKNGLGEKRLVFLTGDTYTTADIVLRDLEKIKENSARIEAEIELRKECLLGSPADCIRPMENFGEPEAMAADNIEPEILPKKILNLRDDVDYSGPYEVNSSCWKSPAGSRQYLYVSQECADADGYCLESSNLGTNIYFEKVEKGNLRFEKYIREQGVLLIPQSATNPYECMNLEFQPRLATINYFYKKYKDKRFYEGMKAGDIFRELSSEAKGIIEKGVEAEQKFFDVKYPSEYELEYLGNYYGYTYSYFSKNKINAGKDDLLERHSIIKEKMADIDLVVNKILNIFSGYRKKAGPDNPPLKAYIYFVRSNYSIFFLNFSSGVWRSDGGLGYLNIKDDLIGKGEVLPVFVIDRNDAIRAYGEEKVQEWLDVYNKNVQKRYGTYDWNLDALKNMSN
ncbi:MAG: hypothetical protein WC788_07805 [Candidatus Paceibacterota bacterium]